MNDWLSGVLGGEGVLGGGGGRALVRCQRTKPGVERWSIGGAFGWWFYSKGPRWFDAASGLLGLQGLLLSVALTGIASSWITVVLYVVLTVL